VPTPGLRPRIRSAVASALALGLAALSSGCASTERARARIGATIDAIVQRSLPQPRDAPRESPLPPPRTLAAAIERVCGFDVNLAEEEAEVAKAQLAVDQARSSAWPRVSIEASTEVPLGRSVEDVSSTVSAGVFVKYDLLKALFSGDAATLERLRLHRAEEQREHASKDLVLRLLEGLSELESARCEAARSGEAAALTARAAAYSQRLRGTGKLPAASADHWQAERAAEEIRWHQAQQREVSAERRLWTLTGIEEWSPALTGEAIEAVEGAPVPRDELERRPLVLGAWKSRNDLQAAADDVYISGLEVEAARIKRYPRFFAALGLGNVLLRSRDITAPVVPFVGVTMPLFDKGDVSRVIALAELGHHQAQARLERRIRSLVEDVENVLGRLGVAGVAQDEARRAVERAEASQTTWTGLLHTPRADPLQAWSAELARLRAERELGQARQDRRLVLLEWFRVTGQLPQTVTLPAAGHEDP
jgi:outer membrane protein TolC